MGKFKKAINTAKSFFIMVATAIVTILGAIFIVPLIWKKIKPKKEVDNVTIEVKEPNKESDLNKADDIEHTLRKLEE